MDVGDGGLVDGFELGDDSGPGVVAFDEGATIGGELGDASGVGQQGQQGLRKLADIGGNQQIATVLGGDGGSGEWAGDDWGGAGHRFEDLILNAGTIEKRCDGQGGATQVGAKIRHFAGYLDLPIGAARGQRAQLCRGILANNADPHVWRWAQTQGMMSWTRWSAALTFAW